MSAIRIGTSGWSYPEGVGTWNGVFYPAPSRARGRGTFDELAYYAERFDTVEVNSSFYRTPSPQTTRSWARRTPRAFEFSMKLFQKFTHPKMFRESTGVEDARPTRDDVDAFKACLDPLAADRKLGALLAQFPPSFDRTDAHCDYLAWLLETFEEHPLAVELRHRTWSDRRVETESLLTSHGAAWVQIDEPKFRFSVRQDFVPNVDGLYYLRLHGRNAAQWWTHEHAEDRYNYLYSREELEPVEEIVDAVGHLVKKLYLYFNNHFAAKAVANAVMLKKDLGLAVGGTYPAAFVEAYPALRGVVATSASQASGTLF
ncbi:MAG: DUF72 domain-containing protein [Vicinamibacterales bacterium]